MKMPITRSLKCGILLNCWRCLEMTKFLAPQICPQFDKVAAPKKGGRQFLVFEMDYQCPIQNLLFIHKFEYKCLHFSIYFLKAYKIFQVLCNRTARQRVQNKKEWFKSSFSLPVSKACHQFTVSHMSCLKVKPLMAGNELRFVLTSCFHHHLSPCSLWSSLLSLIFPNT